MKRTIKFKDKNNNLFTIDIEIKEGRLSICGEGDGGCGQCQDSIIPKNKYQEQLKEVWYKWHLNDIHAGTEKQEYALYKYRKDNNINSSDYNKEVEYLKSIGLYEDNGYKYGTSWLKRELPTNIEDFINTTCDMIEEIEQEEKLNLAKNSNIVWNDIEDIRIVALGKQLNISPSEAKQDIKNISNNYYNYCGIDYFVGTEEEAEEEARQYLKDSELWQNMVAEGHTTLGEDEWIEETINGDGVGQILNSYDGTSDDIKINGLWYVICRI